MKTKIYFPILLSIIIVSTNSVSAKSTDVITINEIFVNSEGRVAIKTNEPVINANTEFDCKPNATWDEYYIGIGTTANDRLVAIIMQAYSMGKQLRVTTDGCEGDWHKIEAIYILP